MKINAIILFFLLSISTLLAQNIKLGFRIEPAFLITDTENLITPYSFYASILYQPTKYLDFEFRPGFLFSGEKYSGFEIGIFANYRIIPTKLIISIGINNHSNLGYSRNGFGSYSTDVFYIGFGPGIQIDNNLRVDIMYYYPTSGVYAYSFIADEYYENKMVGILKLGFSLAWNIL